MAGNVPDDRYSGLLVQAYRGIRYDRARNPRSVSQILGALLTFYFLLLVGCLIFGLIFDRLYLPVMIFVQSMHDKELNEFRNELCHRQMVCSAYSSVRQQCAIAGDFNNCVSIKMGNDAMFQYSCTVDGSVINEIDRANMPNTIECWARNAGLVPRT